MKSKIPDYKERFKQERQLTIGNLRMTMDEAFEFGYRAGLKQGGWEIPATLPRPCDGPLYSKWTPMDYMHKVDEEGHELYMAFREWQRKPNRETRKKFLLECQDQITAVTSLMNACGCDEPERQNLTAEVNSNN